jgi:hypothetical protein
MRGERILRTSQITWLLCPTARGSDIIFSQMERETPRVSLAKMGIEYPIASMLLTTRPRIEVNRMALRTAGNP